MTFQDQRAYKTEWYRFPDGSVQSFRFERDRYLVMRTTVVRMGGVRVEDPFRKGAPVGGFNEKAR
jgi:hypothetical protein